MINFPRIFRGLLDFIYLISHSLTYLFYFALTIIIEVVIFELGTLIIPTSFDRQYLSYASSILVVLVYISVQEHFRKPSKLQTTLNNIMNTETNIILLEKKLIEAISTEFGIAHATFLLVSDFAAKPVGSLDQINDELTKYSKLEKRLHQIKVPMILDELKDSVDKDLFKELDIVLILPLLVGTEDIGLFILGPRRDHKIYPTRYIRFLESISAQLALALKNADNYRQIQDFSRVLEIKIIDRTHELEASQLAQLKLKDEFVFIATHDIATPVTAITGFTDLINHRQEELSPELKNYLGAITEATARLKILVNDLLQIARSESGTIKVALTEVDAGPIIESVVREITPLAQKKNLTITLNLSPDNHLKADPIKLTEVIENIVSNGVKYNRDGGSLNISSILNGNKVVIEFKDTGIGIPSNEHSRVFTKFFRSESTEARKNPGTGLGLFVARMLIEKMGGTISFISLEGQGTTFKLELNR